MARQQLNIRRRSIVSYTGISEHGQCGYCKFTKGAQAKANFVVAANANEVASPSPNNDITTTSAVQNSDAGANDSASSAGPSADDNEGNSAVFGLWAHQLTVQHYQCLADRGWRRSGRYLYKPLMELTCCPQYTIRLDVHEFRLSRTQKRVLRAVRDFLQTDRRPSGRAVVREEQRGAKDGQQKQRKRRRRTSPTTSAMESPQQPKVTIADGTITPEHIDKKTANGMERLPKKKAMRKHRAEERLKARGINLEEYKRKRAAQEVSRRSTVQSFLEGYNGMDWAHTFELRLVGQPSDELEQDFEEEFELFRRYQMQIHREKEDDLTQDSFRRFLAASPLFSVGSRTAERRQTTADNDNGAHGDDTEQQHMGGGHPSHLPPPLGSYHQQYRLDGRLIAVAVIDLLPHCLSAKYFFYDPDYAFLSLGTYSALREIAFTQQLAQQRPDLHFYYMGFYLYDCPKMRYKSRFRPSELLCDHCLNWVPVEECDRMIEANGGRFCTFHPSGEPARPHLDAAQMDKIMCLYGEPARPLTFANLRHSLAAAANASFPDIDNEQQDSAVVASGHSSSLSASFPAPLLRQLMDKVHLYAYHAGPAALEMALFVQ